MNNRKQIIEESLKNFSGTSIYYEYKMLGYSIKLTKGAYFLASAGHAFWLFNIILCYQLTPKFLNLYYQSWKLRRSDGNSFVLTANDSDKNKLAEQHIPFSDFPLDAADIWLIDKVCMLPSEY